MRRVWIHYNLPKEYDMTLTIFFLSIKRANLRRKCVTRRQYMTDVPLDFGKVLLFVPSGTFTKLLLQSISKVFSRKIITRYLTTPLSQAL